LSVNFLCKCSPVQDLRLPLIGCYPSHSESLSTSRESPHPNSPAPLPKMPKKLSLYQLIPNREMKLPGNKVVLGREDLDEIVLQAIRAAVLDGSLSCGKGRQYFYDLFGHVQRHLGLRTHSRDLYWDTVAQSWTKSSGISLHPVFVEDIVLAITIAERKWQGERTVTSPFLDRVRGVNEYFRVHEAHSDEAAEFREKLRIKREQALVTIESSRPKIVLPTIPWQEQLGHGYVQPPPADPQVPVDNPLSMTLEPAGPDEQMPDSFSMQDEEKPKKKRKNNPGLKQRQKNMRRKERERKEREDQDKSQATTTAAEIHPNPFASLTLALRPAAGVKRGPDGDSEDEPPLKRLKTMTLVVRGGRPETQPMGESSDE
jgi:hypothetical protein